MNRQNYATGNKKMEMAYTLDEAAFILGVAPGTVRQWRKKSVKDPSNCSAYVTYIGKRPIVSRANLEQYVNGLPPMNSLA